MLPGVYKATKKDGTLYYRSSITFKGKHISLGSYATKDHASNAYKEANTLLTSSLSLSDYEEEKNYLTFSKWVILCNYRDNNLYIKTPIYLKKNFFYYYFSMDDFYIFDIDDLFYYANHTISRRGGHLFVADYGMQVNILSRYGIKNYSVRGKDFNFKNGNYRDFRYENIEIINFYHGVHKIQRKGTIFYETKIHWNGDLIVGRYKTEIEAAVAYNKAASIMITKGYIKNYPVNYIEELSRSAYQELYKNAPISDTIRNLIPFQ